MLSPFAKGIIAEARPEIIAEARPEIIREAQTDMLLRQLRRRFGVLGKDVEDRVRVATLAQLDDWSERFVDAKVLEDIFTPDRRN